MRSDDVDLIDSMAWFLTVNLTRGMDCDRIRELTDFVARGNLTVPEMIERAILAFDPEE